MWIGTLLLDQELGGFKDVAQLQRAFLDEHADVWERRKCHFYADSGSSEAPLLQHLSEAGFSSWSVSYNRWMPKLEGLACALPTDPFPHRDGRRRPPAVRRRMPRMRTKRVFAVRRTDGKPGPCPSLPPPPASSR